MRSLEWERRRVRQQLKSDLAELTFTADMRQTVMRHVQETALASHLAVVPESAPSRPRPSFWRGPGGWVSGGVLAAAAAFGIFILMGSPRFATDSDFSVAQRQAAPYGAVSAFEEAGTADVAGLQLDPGPVDGLEATPSAPIHNMATNPDVPVGSPDIAVSGAEQETMIALTTPIDEPTATTEWPGNNGAGVAGHRPGASEHRGANNGRPPGEHGREQAERAKTPQEVDSEAEVVALAEVRGLTQGKLDLVPVHAFRGSLPDGKLTVTLPNTADLAVKEVVLVFLRDQQGSDWNLAGGMYGIFRLSADGKEAKSEAGSINMETLRKESSSQRQRRSR